MQEKPFEQEYSGHAEGGSDLNRMYVKWTYYLNKTLLLMNRYCQIKMFVMVTDRHAIKILGEVVIFNTDFETH